MQVQSSTCDAPGTSFPLCPQRGKLCIWQKTKQRFKKRKNKKAGVCPSSVSSRGHSVFPLQPGHPPSRQAGRVHPLRPPPLVRVCSAQHLCCVPLPWFTCEWGSPSPLPSTPGPPWTLLSKHNLILFPFFLVVTINPVYLRCSCGSWNVQPPLCLQLLANLMIIHGCLVGLWCPRVVPILFWALFC